MTADSPKSKAPRASAPKSRNGCLTCKKRRVKCDEKKPKCNACIKSRRLCQWKPSKEELKKSHEILPKDMSRLIQIRPRISQALPFIDAREAYYFWAYQEDAALDLACVLQSTSPWTYTMLQSAQTEPFVLRSLVAIGALNKSIKMSYLCSTCPPAMRQTNQEISKQHRDFALAMYDKAITGMRKIVSSDQDTSTSIRKALISCLLIYTIENFLNSPNTAHVQGQAGFTLLRQLESKHRNHSEGIASPDSHLVEDELYHEFSRLDLRHAMWWGQHSLRRHRTRRMDGELTVKNMPATFGSLEEARVYHGLLMRRTYHLIGEAYCIIMAAKENERHLMIADTPGELVDPCHVPTSLLEDQNEYLVDLTRWHMAFQTVFEKSKFSKVHDHVVGAALMKVHALDASMALAGTFLTEACDFDKFLPEASEIVALARIICMKENPPIRPIFNLSLGLEQALYDVAIMCRDKAVRHEALALLRSHAPFDSTTQRCRMWTRAAYLVSLEEEGRQPNGEIPENARWWRVWVFNHYNEESRHLTLVYTRKKGYPLGRRYPAKREWKKRTFTQTEADNMTFELEDPGFQPWPTTIPKPFALKWEEVHEELLSRRLPKAECKGNN